MLAQALDEVPACAIYSSDLQRAASTAEAIARRRPGLKVHYNVKLRERNLGVLQGLKIEEAAVLQPQAWRCLHARDPSAQIHGGVESEQDMRTRIVSGLQEIAQCSEGETVIAVLHGGPLSVVHRHIMGHGQASSVRNCSISTIKVSKNQWALVNWNDVSHLAPSQLLADGFGGGGGGCSAG